MYICMYVYIYLVKKADNEKMWFTGYYQSANDLMVTHALDTW